MSHVMTADGLGYILVELSLESLLELAKWKSKTIPLET